MVIYTYNVLGVTEFRDVMKPVTSYDDTKIKMIIDFVYERGHTLNLNLDYSSFC